MAETTPKTTVKGKYLEYKGKPLVREGNILLYGDMSEAYCLQLMVLTEKEIKVGDVSTTVPDGIIVQILSTDASKSFSQRLAKQFEKNGLFDALDIGIAWLNKMNQKK